MVSINGKKYKNRTTVDCLRSARQLLIDVGWIQGTFYQRRDGSYSGFCMLGAIKAVDGPNERRAVRVLEDRIGYAIPEYNDGATRTKRGVLAKFTAAITACR